MAISGVYAQTPMDTDSLQMLEGEHLKEVRVTAHSHRAKTKGLSNTDFISSGDLLRAACCNLGESFTTNPSVDVNYSDAATGAQQIRLLGLSGTYVQMLTENIPNYRGAAAPYSLGYIPGPWMQSIQVSKGASSVKNGYESITGQINVEFKKPQASPFADANLFYNTKGKLEANLGANLKLSERWSTALLGHYEILDKAHDENGDGFVDMPKVRQGSLMSRWAYLSDGYIFQAAIKGLKEHREGGQIGHHVAAMHPYLIDITNERYEAFAKNAFIFDPEHGSNIALILSGSLHHQNAIYGQKTYHTDQRNGYASLMFETDFDEHHSLSTGVSLNHDRFDVDETTPGVYAQYTYKVGERFTLMGGLRWDHSNIYGGFLTPRMHLKYSPNDVLTFRGSIGKGYRTNHVMAEYNNLLASSRQIIIDDNLDQEEAWNYGLSANLNIPIGERKLEINAEYYYTTFQHQLLVDMDSNPHAIHFTNLVGDSYSHTWQMEATYPLLESLTMTATYRRTNVKSTYGGVLREKPLTNRYKALFTAQYKPGLGKWQFDATLQLNGGGRMPDAYTTTGGQPAWESSYKGYEQLNAQITRFFRHWSIYAGGENITGRRQQNPIIAASNPWGQDFDATMVWGPMHGAIYYIGIRLNWIKI
ncbi:TonB-dependent siderophore receptor [Prevotella sp. P6B4]|uniref:TonB-dependent receptor plug domain-containing protein n=1 Tax=Prevotella sp. P6B4 TaxID=1410614 RepID=UPI001E322A98|nr:TonB-dependent receptor [Prevotella sp. P6B4]